MGGCQLYQTLSSSNRACPLFGMSSENAQKTKGKRDHSKVFFWLYSSNTFRAENSFPATYVNDGICLDIVYVWILQPQLFATSLCGADNPSSHRVLQRKRAAQGHHELSSPEIRWSPQQQHRKVSLHMGGKGQRKERWRRRTQSASTCWQVTRAWTSTLSHRALPSFLLRFRTHQTLTLLR